MKKKLPVRLLTCALAALLLLSGCLIPALGAEGTEGAPPSREVVRDLTSTAENTALSARNEHPDGNRQRQTPAEQSAPWGQVDFSPYVQASGPVSSRTEGAVSSTPAVSQNLPGTAGNPNSTESPSSSAPVEPPVSPEITASPEAVVSPEPSPSITPEATIFPSISPETNISPSTSPSASPEAAVSPEPSPSITPEATIFPSTSPSASPSISPSASLEDDAPLTLAQALLRAAAAAVSALNDMTPYLKSGGLYHLTDAGEPGEAFPASVSLSTGDAFALQYTFDLTEAQAQAIDTNPNKAYKVPLPANLKWSGAMAPQELKIKYTDGTEGDVFATLTFSGSPAQAAVTFADNLYRDFGGITGGYFYLACALDKGQVQQQEKVTVELATGTTYEVTVTDNAKTDPVLTKEGSWENGRLHWTVHYTPGTKPCELPLTIRDTFDGGLQLYVDGSARISADSDPGGLLSINPTVSEGQLLFEVESPSAAFTLTYDTVLADSALLPTNSNTVPGDKKVSNSAELVDNAGAVLASAAKTVTVAGSSLAWLSKTGTYSSAGRKISWTLTVQTLDRNLENLVLYDLLAQGLTGPQNLKVNGEALPAGFTLDSTCTADGAGSPCSFSLTFPSALTQTKYVVTYDTVIDDSYYDSSHSNTQFTNKAWLSFLWKDYVSGTSAVPHIDPGVTKSVPADTGAIQKSCDNYNRATHELTWRVTLNPYKVNITNGNLIDDLRDRGQTYVNDSFTPISGADYVTAPVVSEGGKYLSFTVGPLGQNTAVFTFKTTVDDPENYAYNTIHGKACRNTVTFQCGSGMPLDGCSASASINVISEVLKKEAASYDYSTGRFTWKVTVNQNKMEMENAVLTDVLAPGLSYVPDSCTVGGSPVTDRAQSVTCDGQTLTIPLGNLSAETGLTFQTALDADAVPDFLTKNEVEIGNSITLSRGGFHDVSADTSFKVKNQVLAKTGDANGKLDYIDYTVDINPNSLTFTTENNRIVDQLPPGLLVDLETVKLYRANVSSGGVLSQGEECPAGDWSFSYDAVQRRLTVTLPENVPQAYVLAYRADIVDRSKGPFQNSISFLGDRMGDAVDSVKSISVGGGGGGGLADRKGSIQIVKVDELAGPDWPVAGAAFGVYNANGDMLDYGVTDSEGVLTFQGLTLDRTYTIKELSAPPGYVKLEGSSIITLDAPNRSYTSTLYNRRVTGNLLFQKANDLGYPLTGVKFLLENKPGTPSYTETLTSGEEGWVAKYTLPYGEYTLTETSTLPHHVLDETVYDVTVDADGTATLSVPGGTSGPDGTNGTTDTLVNEVEKGTLKITKTNRKTGRPMEGVEFTVLDSLGAEKKKGLTDERGNITFPDLMVGETYTVRETRQSGFRPAPDREITLTENGGVLDMAWENEPLPNVPTTAVNIEKVDKSTGLPMAGVAFEIFDKTGERWGRGETDESGRLSFSGLPADTTYTLHEITPEGYADAPDRTLIFGMDENGDYPELSLLWENTPLDEATPTPTPGTGATPTPTPTPGAGGGHDGNGGASTGTNGSGTSGNSGSAGKLPQTGQNRLLPGLMLGAGAALLTAGFALRRRKAGRHEKK